MTNLILVVIWIAITAAAWWLPASVAFLVLLLNLLIADPIPYADEIVMLAIAFKQAVEELLKRKQASQKHKENIAEPENLPSIDSDKKEGQKN